jgi:hypothetical protein
MIGNQLSEMDFATLFNIECAVLIRRSFEELLKELGNNRRNIASKGDQ